MMSFPCAAQYCGLRIRMARPCPRKIGKLQANATRWRLRPPVRRSVRASRAARRLGSQSRTGPLEFSPSHGERWVALLHDVGHAGGHCFKDILLGGEDVEPVIADGFEDLAGDFFGFVALAERRGEHR